LTSSPTDSAKRSIAGARRAVGDLLGQSDNGSMLPAVTPATSWRGRRFGRTDLVVPEVRRPSLTLQDVTKIYPSGKRALADVDLVVPEGDFVFLVGPSGAGKSTLIKLLIRDELPTSGTVILAGRDVARLPRRQVPRLRRQIGTVFQDFKLLPRKSVRENVAFALEVTGTPRRRINPAVERALALVGLTAQAPQYPSQLSGGEQQRTAIARAMVHDPKIIIADEPTGNLDPLISWEIIQLLLRINELGTTVLMATHNAEVVTALRKRVVALEEGRIVRDEVGGYRPDD
jgi:cell division transport system ATP-binding protein